MRKLLRILKWYLMYISPLVAEVAAEMSMWRGIFFFILTNFATDNVCHTKQIMYVRVHSIVGKSFIIPSLRQRDIYQITQLQLITLYGPQVPFKIGVSVRVFNSGQIYSTKIIYILHLNMVREYMYKMFELMRFGLSLLSLQPIETGDRLGSP